MEIEQIETSLSGLICGANFESTSKKRNSRLCSILMFSKRITLILSKRTKLIIYNPISRSLNSIFLKTTSSWVTLAIVSEKTTDFFFDALNFSETSSIYFSTFTGGASIIALPLIRDVRAVLRRMLFFCVKSMLYESYLRYLSSLFWAYVSISKSVFYSGIEIFLRSTSNDKKHTKIGWLKFINFLQLGLRIVTDMNYSSLIFLIWILHAIIGLFCINFLKPLINIVRADKIARK